MTTTKREKRPTVLKLEGEFDISAARVLERSLRAFGPGERVRIDFSRVRKLNDSAIAQLAKSLGKLDPAIVRMDGLGTHHVRMLRYFGVDPDRFRRGRKPDGEAAAE